MHEVRRQMIGTPYSVLVVLYGLVQCILAKRVPVSSLPSSLIPHPSSLFRFAFCFRATQDPTNGSVIH